MPKSDAGAIGYDTLASAEVASKAVDAEPINTAKQGTFAKAMRPRKDDASQWIEHFFRLGVFAEEF